jgi:RNA polymerase sigma factor (sigma-70 family)
MSPLSLRRYRAERLLREEFDGLRGRVIATVRRRLRASGVSLDASDLEACYAQAWHGLYMAVLEGQEVANPTGWLVLVTFRRAIEEQRARERVSCDRIYQAAVSGPGASGGTSIRASSRVDGTEDRDLASELDDRMRLRYLFEALRGRLSAREQEAAALCYLHGLSRSAAAERLGVSEKRMRKLMEGQGPERPGVAGKVGALVETIRGGGWCEEQGSLMRGLAYGILDPEGERYRLAVIHRSECPACRAYVVSLRGLAAALPPLPSLLHWALGSGGSIATGTGAGAGTAAAAAHSSGGVGASAGAAGGAGALAPAGPAVGGALPATGAVGAGAVGGGWLLAGGPVGAKLAVGCLLALGVGAGCVALTERSGRAPAPRDGRDSARAAGARASAVGHGAGVAERPLAATTLGAGGAVVSGGAGTASASALASAGRSPIARATREFGPEQGLAPSGPRSPASATARAAPSARSASAGVEPARAAEFSATGPTSAVASAPTGRSSGATTSSAQREFAPG